MITMKLNKNSILSSLTNVIKYTHKHPWDTQKEQMPIKLFQDYPKTMKFLGLSDDHYYNSANKFLNRNNDMKINNVKRGIYPIIYNHTKMDNNIKPITPNQLSSFISERVRPLVENSFQDFDVQQTYKSSIDSIRNTTPKDYQPVDYSKSLSIQNSNLDKTLKFKRMIRRKRIAKPVEKVKKYLSNPKNKFLTKNLTKDKSINDLANAMTNNYDKSSLQKSVNYLFKKQKEQIALHTHEFDNKSPLRLFYEQSMKSHRTDYGAFFDRNPKLANEMDIHSGQFIKSKLMNNNERLINGYVNGRYLNEKDTVINKINDNNKRIHKLNSKKAYKGFALNNEIKLTKLNMLANIKNHLNNTPQKRIDRRLDLITSLKHSKKSAYLDPNISKGIHKIYRNDTDFKYGQLFDRHTELQKSTGILGSQSAVRRVIALGHANLPINKQKLSKIVSKKLNNITTNKAYKLNDIDTLSTNLKPLSKKQISNSIQNNPNAYNQLPINEQHELKSQLKVHHTIKFKKWNKAEISAKHTKIRKVNKIPHLTNPNIIKAVKRMQKIDRQ